MIEVTEHPDEPDERLRIAKERFEYCVAWEAIARQNFQQDVKFANADAYNGYQWPNDIRQNRDIDDRPCLTVNKTMQHNLQIINDMKQNKPGIAIRAVSNGATFEAAQMWEGIMRHIEYQSKATTAYSMATKWQVEGGIGYLRVVTDYIDDKSFDQEIYIKGVDDPLTVYIDPDAKEPDKSDMRFAFIYTDVPKDEFELKYPRLKGKVSTGAPLGLGDGDWITDKHVRIAEYYHVVEKDDMLLAVPNPRDGSIMTILASLLPEDMREQEMNDIMVRKRRVISKQIEWDLIVGGDIIEEENKPWPGKYIPIVPVIGSEYIIDGVMDRRGHTRALLDPQRIYNFWSSSAVEHVALQSKTPYIAAALAVEGYEDMWNNANRENYSALLYNAFDDAGNEIPPPERAQPPVMAQAYIQGMQIAGMEMMMVSGQYQAQMGEQGNERSGKAIEERQRQGDNATYHFIDNLGIAIGQLGRILLDLTPYVYDTQRVININAEDGTSYDIQIDPRQQQAFQQKLDNDNKIAARIFNPKVGMYEVEADIGPSYGTKRQEAFHALTLLLTQAPQLTTVIGDLLLKSGDFPLADEAAARLRRMIPPQALGEGPTQQEQALQQQVQQLTGLLQKSMEELGMVKLKLTGKTEMRDIDSYDAETKRMAALAKMLGTDEGGLAKIIKQLVEDALQTHITQVTNANQDDLQAETGDVAPLPNARKANDGQWYVPDHNRPGKFMRVSHG